VRAASAGTGIANGTRTGGTRQARLARGWRGEICDRFAIGDGVGRAGCPGVFADFDARLNFGIASRSGGASLALRARVGGAFAMLGRGIASFQRCCLSRRSFRSGRAS
jgi:hypothetical protein